jgi:hypothetical protein
VPAVLEWFRRWSWGRKGPRIYVFGDSHAVALLKAQAYEKRRHMFADITVLRILKQKNGEAIGDESLDRFCRRIALLGPQDFVFSAVGGNQYAMLSTVRHERDFKVLGDGHEVGGEAEIVPRRAFKSFVESSVRNTDGPILQRIRASTRARVFHLLPPPPKFDNDFIRNFHERSFADAGLGEFEPTDPAFRLACWTMQQQCLAELCAEVDVTLLPPPACTLTPDGYLDPHHYSGDVTHANRRYGEQVLRQILGVAIDLNDRRMVGL